MYQKMKIHINLNRGDEVTITLTRIRYFNKFNSLDSYHQITGPKMGHVQENPDNHTVTRICPKPTEMIIVLSVPYLKLTIYTT